MRWSWLSNPAVALLNFLAAVITVAEWFRRLAQILVRLVRGIRRIIASPEPLSIQVANAVDGLGYELAYLVNASDPVSSRACSSP
jgi:hypothetical protein